MKQLKQIYQVFILVFFTLIITNCTSGNGRNKLPQKNLKDFRPESSFIFLNVENKKNSYIIVIENSIFYDNIQKEYNWGKLEYILKMNKLISNKKSLLINDEIYSKLKENILDTNLISSFNKLNVINDSNLINSQNIINPRIEKKKQLDIIYTLLNKNIRNCKADDESGLILVSAP
jgi:hypothetical protein